jgi:chemotaxis response regulator CheB
MLIVDDSTFTRAHLKRLFSDVNEIEFAEAANGIEVLEQHRTFKPEVIFMDITMPQLDGLATLKILKMIDKSVKIIMVSSLGNQKYIYDHCINYGACAILNKPLTKQMALDALKNAVTQTIIRDAT